MYKQAVSLPEGSARSLIGPQNMQDRSDGPRGPLSYFTVKPPPHLSFFFFFLTELTLFLEASDGHYIVIGRTAHYGQIHLSCFCH